ncbi:hypothetical protein PV08_12052 [Exophiala spinifera]|uniref:J domain-containing protein n=1 Tax=Exophiala spinifera TaxID=91928 RepID=A0A0D2BE88_9EURO|nr:uncharacterized protein PV08_12052 [Exophiala spinifera]KIW09709.1 hypothetical protein PV08_12052 [Exophiala spinifera]
MSSGNSAPSNNPQLKALGDGEASNAHGENGKTDQQANPVGYPPLPPPEGSSPTPDSDGDVPMADTGVKATNEGSGGGAKPGGKSSNKKTGRKYTKEQREEVNRVLNCKDTDLYQLLDLPPHTVDFNIRKNYLKISTLIHPDKNADKETTTAFQRVNAAYEVLSNPQKKREYDAKLRTNQANEANNNQDGTFGEEFGPNAWGDDSDSDDSSDDSSDEDNVDNGEQVPDEFRMRIYEQATPHVNKLLAKYKDSSSQDEIELLNQKIRGKNEGDRLPNKESFLIRTEVLRAIGLEMSHVKSRLKKNPKDEDAFNQLVSLDKQLKKLCRNNHYPESWRLNIPDDWRQRVEEYEAAEGGGKGKGKDGNSGPSGARSEKASGTKSGSSNETPQHTGSARARSEKTSRTKSGSSNEPSQSTNPGVEEVPSGESNTMAKKPYWEPGLTKDGEKILGYRPFCRRDRRTGVEIMFGVQFVVEQRGSDNPVILLSGTEVGHRATNAYFDLPASERKDIRYSDRKYSYEDVANFEELLGFATKKMECMTLSEPATGYGLVKFKNGETDILSRTALRKMLGKKDADDEIKVFAPSSHLIEPPPVKGQLTSGSDGPGKTELRARLRGKVMSGSDGLGKTERRARLRGKVMPGSDGPGEMDLRAFETDDPEELFIPEQKPRKRKGSKAAKGLLESPPENSDLMAAIMAQLARLEQKVLQLSD